MPIALAVVPLVVAALCLALYIRGDRRRDLRRCPRCRYDMARVPALKCPECGHAPAAETGLHFTHRRRRFAVCAALGVVVALVLGATNPVVRDRVVNRLPRPVLAWALEVFVFATPTAAGGDIPTGPTAPTVPMAAQRRSLWSRLAWNQQYALAIRAWGDLVASDDPKVLADLPRIHAALAEMDKWQAASGATAWIDAWVQMDEIDQQRLRIESLPARHVKVTLADGTPVSLDRNELLMLAFQAPRNQSDGVGLKGEPYISAPQEYLSAMIAACGPAAQKYALIRLASEPNGTVDIDALMAKLATSTTCPAATRDAAADLGAWRPSFLKRMMSREQPGR